MANGGVNEVVDRLDEEILGRCHFKYIARLIGLRIEIQSIERKRKRDSSGLDDSNRVQFEQNRQ
jgi:hypothetical protein